MGSSFQIIEVACSSLNRLRIQKRRRKQIGVKPDTCVNHESSSTQCRIADDSACFASCRDAASRGPVKPIQNHILQALPLTQSAWAMNTRPRWERRLDFDEPATTRDDRR